MKLLRKTFFLTSLFFYAAISFADIATDDPVIPMPTGNYSVGYQNFYWVDDNACPDPFYNGENGNDFNADNPRHCRQMMVRVYYPSLAPKVMATLYDPSQTTQLQSYIVQALPNTPAPILDSLSHIYTWDAENAPLASGNCPVVIFSPGDMTNENDYVSLIDELVSQGYIVLAINNTFMSASVTFPNGPTVINDSTTDPARRTSIAKTATHEDINFALTQLFTLHNTNSIFTAMDLNNIGIMGHSLGADLVMYLGHTEAGSKFVKAAIALDPCAESPWFTSEYQDYRFNIPFMAMHTDHWFTVYGNPQPTIQINQDGYFIAFSDMGHMNFSDESLFQYQEAIQYAMTYSSDFYNALFPSNGYQLGTINGSDIIRVENAYVLQFFNHYLKGEPLGWLASQTPYSPLVTGEYIGPASIDSANWQNY